MRDHRLPGHDAPCYGRSRSEVALRPPRWSDSTRPMARATVDAILTDLDAWESLLLRMIDERYRQWRDDDGGATR
jgi:hypothetical protein